MWNIVTEKRYQNRQHIFPTQQTDVGTLVEAFSSCPQVEKILIFGSSVTAACNPWSDIDIYVQLQEEVRLKRPLLPVPVDLWTNFTADESLLAEIKEKGVVVYERDAIGQGCV